MPDPFTSSILAFGKSALKSLRKDSQDAAVFIAFAIIFVAATHLARQIWPIIIVLLVLVVGYCWRRDRSEQFKIRAARDKLDAETARVQVLKQTHRAMGETTQPARPLNPRPRKAIRRDE